MQMKRWFAFGSLFVFAAGLAYAADQTILGSSITVKNPNGTNAARKITGKAKEKGSPNTIVGNPTTLGGSLTVSAGGGTPSTQVFPLPQGTSITGKPFWSGDAIKGFKYKDPTGQNGAVKGAQIKKTPSGNFSIKIVAAGKLGPILVTPPNPGTNSCILLALNGGDTYSVDFKAGDGLVTNKGTQLYKQKKVTQEGSCLIATTTTTSTSSTTSTTLYGSPSKAFFDRVVGLLD
jgi:hypothetical protein